MAAGASTVPAPGWAPAARAWAAGMRAPGREASRPRPGDASGRREVQGWGRRGGMGQAPGRNGGTKDTFLSTYIYGFPEPAPRGGMVPRLRGGCREVPGRARIRPGRQAGAQKTPPAISGDGGLPFMLSGHFWPCFDFSAAVPVDYASRAVSRPGRMSLTNNTLLKTLSKILLLT